jgi:hypothetical protein
VTVVLRTLADYHQFRLTAFCQLCDRSAQLDHAALAERFGAEVLLDTIRQRVRCRQCGRRSGRLLVGYHQGGGAGRDSLTGYPLKPIEYRPALDLLTGSMAGLRLPSSSTTAPDVVQRGSEQRRSTHAQRHDRASYDRQSVRLHQ